MSSPAVSCVRHLIDEYRRFLRSTYRLADPKLREQFEQHISQADVLVKGPYVTLAREFAKHKTLTALLAEKVGHPDLAKFNWPFGADPLFVHQEKALRLVDGAGRNCVIKTGTGSGRRVSAACSSASASAAWFSHSSRPAKPASRMAPAHSLTLKVGTFAGVQRFNSSRTVAK